MNVKEILLEMLAMKVNNLDNKNYYHGKYFDNLKKHTFVELYDFLVNLHFMGIKVNILRESKGFIEIVLDLEEVKRYTFSEDITYISHWDKIVKDVLSFLNYKEMKSYLNDLATMNIISYIHKLPTNYKLTVNVEISGKTKLFHIDLLKNPTKQIDKYLEEVLKENRNENLYTIINNVRNILINKHSIDCIFVITKDNIEVSLSFINKNKIINKFNIEYKEGDTENEILNKILSQTIFLLDN